MKPGLLSLLIGLISILLTIGYNFIISNDIIDSIIKGNYTIESLPGIGTNLILSLVGMIGLFLGIVGILKKNNYSKIGAIISLIAIIMAFIPIYSYIIEDSALDLIIQ